MGDGEIAVSKALALHLLCALGLAVGYFAAGIAYNLSLVTDPAQTLSFLLLFEAPIVVASYSLVRRERDRFSYWKAVFMALFGLPVGALLNALGAIVLGAPVGLKYWLSTIYWSCLMSLFTFVPAVCVFGWSRMDWQRILANSKPKHATDCLVSFPAQGAIVGAWLGAWPMPLDWERPWQEWPICVTYGAVAGYIVEEEKRADIYSPQLVDQLCEQKLNSGRASYSENVDDRRHTELLNFSPEKTMKRNISVDDVLCSSCKEMIYKPMVLNCGHVYCETCLYGLSGDPLRCQICESLHPSEFPNLCLDYFLEEAFPTEYAVRREQVHLKKTQSLAVIPSPNACPNTGSESKDTF